jgi:predicted nucleic acid-binding protein
MPLDEGEKAAALTLDVTLGADLILIDERKGAAAARVKGLELTTSCEVCSRGTEKNEFFDGKTSVAMLVLDVGPRGGIY